MQSPRFVYTGHSWLIKFLQSMGYKGNENGMCFGVAQMAKQAALAGEMDRFDRRILFIYLFRNTPQVIIDAIKTIKIRNKQKIPLTDEQNQILDIQAFLEGVELYQIGYKHHQEVVGAFGDDAVTSMITPEKLLKNGGRIEKVSVHEDPYSKKNLEKFLLELQRIVESKTFPVSVILGANCHATTVSYDPKNKEWIFVDANQLPSKRIPFANIVELKTRIVDAYKAVRIFGDEKTLLDATIYVHNDNTKSKDIEKFKAECDEKFSEASAWTQVKLFIRNHPIKSALFLCGLALLFAAACLTGVGIIAVLSVGAVGFVMIAACFVANPLDVFFRVKKDEIKAERKMKNAGIDKESEKPATTSTARMVSTSGKAPSSAESKTVSTASTEAKKTSNDKVYPSPAASLGSAKKVPRR